jgi:hypothetical protein
VAPGLKGHDSVQQWIAVLGTALGAVIGIGSAFVNDRVRWRREQDRDRRGVRRELYASYIAALTEIHEAMRAASGRAGLNHTERAEAIYGIFQGGGLYQLRYQIGIVADQQVLDAAEAAFQQMRDIRDAFADGRRIRDPEYQTLRSDWGARLRDLQQAMREELGSARVTLRGGS